jgi:hypothetical protein
MKTKQFCIFTALLFVLGCARDPALFSARHLSRVQVGEEKEFALMKLGPDFTPLVLENKSGDKYEVMEYREKPAVIGKLSERSWRLYRVYFINNKLVGYERARDEGIIPYENWIEAAPSIGMPGKRIQAVSLTQYFDER